MTPNERVQERTVNASGDEIVDLMDWTTDQLDRVKKAEGRRIKVIIMILDEDES